MTTEEDRNKYESYTRDDLIGRIVMLEANGERLSGRLSEIRVQAKRFDSEVGRLTEEYAEIEFLFTGKDRAPIITKDEADRLIRKARALDRIEGWITTNEGRKDGGGSIADITALLRFMIAEPEREPVKHFGEPCATCTAERELLERDESND